MDRGVKRVPGGAVRGLLNLERFLAGRAPGLKT